MPMGTDEVTVDGILGIKEYLHARDMAQAWNLVCSLHHVDQQRVLLQMDACHTGRKLFAAILGVGEVTAIQQT